MARTLTQAGPDRTNRLLFGGAIGLALLAALFVFLALANTGGDGGDSFSVAGAVEVVVAADNIDAGERIGADMLTTTRLPSDSVLDGALTGTEGVVGLVARVPLQRGEQVTSAKVGADSDAEGAAAVVPQGYRAMAVEVDENTSVGGLIVPGDRVDVIGVVEYEERDGYKEGITLLQNVEVLAVAQESLEPVTRLDSEGNIIETDRADGVLGSRPDDTDPNADAQTVTLAIRAEDAPLLALAQEDGTIFLALRGAGDGEEVDVPGRFIGDSFEPAPGAPIGNE